MDQRHPQRSAAKGVEGRQRDDCGDILCQYDIGHGPGQHRAVPDAQAVAAAAQMRYRGTARLRIFHKGQQLRAVEDADAPTAQDAGAAGHRPRSGDEAHRRQRAEWLFIGNRPTRTTNHLPRGRPGLNPMMPAQAQVDRGIGLRQLCPRFEGDVCRRRLRRGRHAAECGNNHRPSDRTTGQLAYTHECLLSALGTTAAGRILAKACCVARLRDVLRFACASLCDPVHM